MKFVKIIFIALIGTYLMSEASASSLSAPKYSIFAYAGEYHNRHIHQILTGDVKKDQSYVWSVAGTRKLYQISNNLILEGELNLAYHTRKQHHFEISASANLRWITFPWDNYVNTTLAYGLGPSYALEKPAIEGRRDCDPAQLLIFMPVELTLGPPQVRNSQWETFTRIHHRSGAWGVVSNSKGSNFISAGIRYRF